jgi:diaminohydroxyphosphoribosylaminopyrimidine deaminase/5-amino-6-(5-phosphoribosylamino)uracil reductase
VITAGAPARALVITGEGASRARVEALSATGASVAHVGTRDGRIDLHAALGLLAAREVRTVLVEGGGEVHGAFLDAGLVDRVAVFVAPRLLGGRQATPAIAGVGRPLASALCLTGLEVTRIGDDLLVEGDAERGACVPGTTARPRPDGD